MSDNDGMTLEQRQRLLTLLENNDLYALRELYPEPAPEQVERYKTALKTYKSDVFEHTDGTVWVKVDVSGDTHGSVIPRLMVTFGDRAYKLSFSKDEFAALAEALRVGAACAQQEHDARQAHLMREDDYSARMRAWQERKNKWVTRLKDWWEKAKPKNRRGKSEDKRVSAEDLPVELERE
ncbi:MAG: hypothetical protein MUF38_19905 [Anaerolineae bacterium]|jgi:hypothetical protein|nr:hypothetical protein [Anaerolineae bacterium]